MTIRCDTDLSLAPCCATAAYLHALSLDGARLAWEFLRRHPGYRAGWQQASRSERDRMGRRWGLRCRS